MSIFDIFRKASKQGKEDYPQMLEWGTYGAPKWSTQKDREYITEAYKKLVWVYVCASIIGANVSKVNWELWRIGKGQNTKDRQIYEHPLLMLVNQRINTHFTSKDFFEIWALSLALQGKFFCKLNSPMYPTKLYPLYSHLVKPIPDEIKFISGFQYDPNGKADVFAEDIVLWSKLTDPEDYYEGLSPVKAMARTIDSENEAVDWNKSQLQNQAVPPGAISVVNPGSDLIKMLTSEWKKRYSGPRNARVPIILNSEKASYIPFGLSPIDMDFLGLRKLTRVEICAGFGIPGQLAGDPEGQTYANMEQAEKTMWNHTLIPKYLDRMKDDLNLYLAQRYADNLEFRYNLDDIEALHEGMAEKGDRAMKLYKARLITKNEGRFMIDHDEVEGGDEYYEAPYVSDDKDKDDEETKPPEVEDDEKGKGKGKKKDDFEVKAINMSEEQKELYWKSLEADREEYIKSVTKLLEENFDKERVNVVSAIKNDKSIENAIETMSKDKLIILQALYKVVIKDFGQKTYRKISNLKAEMEFSISDEIARYIREQTAQQVVQVNETTISQISQRIQLAQGQGMSIRQISRLIDDLYLEQIIPNRSEVIARTETVSSSNYGSYRGALQAQEDYDIQVKKIWIATYDGRVRPTHAVAGGHDPIHLHERFTVGNSEMLYPGDYLGGADEVVRCRCALGYVRDN